MRPSLWLMGILAGCAPPPLTETTEAGLPSIDILFPESRDDVVVCPDLVVVVDVDNFAMGPPGEPDLGHWHLKDSGGNFILASSEDWASYTFGPDESFPTPQLTSLSVALAETEHTELNTLEFPDAIATAEFYMGATDDCVGGVIHDADTGLDSGL